jgi:hypothetical protein
VPSAPEDGVLVKIHAAGGEFGTEFHRSVPPYEVNSPQKEATLSSQMLGPLPEAILERKW